MRLAADEITIRLDGETLFLRPTLRAAARLERRHGFPALYRGITEGSVTVITDIIREGAGLPTFTLHASQGLVARLAPLTFPLFAFVLMLNGFDEDAEPATDAEEARTTFAEHYEALYRIATGWLGWTPAEALDATPNEIAQAYLGRVEMLKAIFGGAEKPPEDTRTLDQKFASVMRQLDRFGGKEAAQ